MPTKVAEGYPVLLLHSWRGLEVKDGESIFEGLGLKVDLPEHYSGRIMPIFKGIGVSSETICSREIFIDISNHSGKDYLIEKGAPIAKFVVEEIIFPEPKFAKTDDESDFEENVWCTSKEKGDFISYQFKITKPQDGYIFPGDYNLIQNKIKMFLKF